MSLSESIRKIFLGLCDIFWAESIIDCSLEFIKVSMANCLSLSELTWEVVSSLVDNMLEGSISLLGPVGICVPSTNELIRGLSKIDRGLNLLGNLRILGELSHELNKVLLRHGGQGLSHLLCGGRG